MDLAPDLLPLSEDHALYAIASRGFTARFNSVDKTNRLSAIREREWIRRDMRYFCKEMVNPATIPRSLFYCLTQLCRGIDAGEIDSVHIRHATWAEIRNYLLTPLGEPPITFELYREAICPFLWSYIDGDPAIPTESAQASTSTTTTAQTSHVPPASPQPSHAETRTATTPGRNLPPLPLPEDYKS